MTWLVAGLIVAVLLAFIWLAFRGGDIDDELEHRRRSAEDRLRAREERAERRRRLGLPDDEGET